MHILFICTGNICRSPMAEGLFRQMVRQRSDITVESAGIVAAQGMPASPEAVHALASAGIDISHHQSRRVDLAMVNRADFIFGMTGAHLDALLRQFPFTAEKLFLVREFDESAADDRRDVPDPIGMGQPAYDRCRESLESALPSILEFLDQTRRSLSLGKTGGQMEPSRILVTAPAESPDLPSPIVPYLRESGYQVDVAASSGNPDDDAAACRDAIRRDRADFAFRLTPGDSGLSCLLPDGTMKEIPDRAAAESLRASHDARILAMGAGCAVGRELRHVVDGFLTAQAAINKTTTHKEKRHGMRNEPDTIIDSQLATLDPDVAQAIANEERRQSENIELIASENYTSKAVMAAQGSVLTNKYAEGYPGKRWYGGCEHVDVVESLAIDRAIELFGADHANVQPHSGSQANMAVYFSVLEPGDRILTMDLAHGGHLTHGHQANFSGKLYTVSHYGVSEKDERIDYDALARQARECKPRMITVGASAYPRIIDFKRMREIADEVGACLFADMAHIAGLVAGGIHPSPVPHADFVTTTTHKSLRGPRGGLILCRGEYAKKIDSRMFPGVQGGPLMHVIAAKAVCLGEALKPEFKDYAAQIVANAKALAVRLSMNGYRIVSGGTDNHVMLVDVRPQEMSGKEAQEALDKAGITVNKNAIPFDTMPIMKTGGIRIGTPAMTTRGMKEEEMMDIADLIHEALQARDDDQTLAKVRERVLALTAQYPLP